MGCGYIPYTSWPLRPSATGNRAPIARIASHFRICIVKGHKRAYYMFLLEEIPPFPKTEVRRWAVELCRARRFSLSSYRCASC